MLRTSFHRPPRLILNPRLNTHIRKRDPRVLPLMTRHHRITIPMRGRLRAAASVILRACCTGLGG